MSLRSCLRLGGSDAVKVLTSSHRGSLSQLQVSTVPVVQGCIAENPCFILTILSLQTLPCSLLHSMSSATGYVVGFCYITVTGPSAGDEPHPCPLGALVIMLAQKLSNNAFMRQVFSSSTPVPFTSSARPQHGMVTHMVTIGKREV